MLRHKAGLLPLREAREQVGFQMALLKAIEQIDIEARLERLEAIMEDRRR